MKRCWAIPQIEYGAFSDITETRKATVVTTRSAWEAVEDRLCLPTASRIDITEASLDSWKPCLAKVKGDVVYAVGGGLAADAGKYLASELSLPLVCLPTALSVDAFLTWASGVRRSGCVHYIETKCPDQLIVDFDVLSSAPEAIRAAGVCDVLSIATGNWDWEYADMRGLNSPETRFIPYASDCAAAILKGTLDCAESAGRGEPEGLKQLLDCLALEVQLCNLIGHARPEEGSEHYFAYAVENAMGKGLPHGDLVGPGILLMAGLQGQETSQLRQALAACHIPLDNIPKDAVQATLRNLPEYCRKHKLAHGLAHDLNEELIQRADA